MYFIDLQIALSTFLLNLSIAHIKSQNIVRLWALINLIAQTILNLNEPEAEFRSFVALGTILTDMKNVAPKLASNDIVAVKQKLNTISNNNSTEQAQIRNKNCAKQLIALLVS